MLSKIEEFRLNAKAQTPAFQYRNHEILNIFSRILEPNRRIVIVSRGTSLKQVMHACNMLRPVSDDTIVYEPFKHKIYNITTNSQIRFLTTGPASCKKICKWHDIDEVFLYGVDSTVAGWREICEKIAMRKNEHHQIETVSEIAFDELRKT